MGDTGIPLASPKIFETITGIFGAGGPEPKAPDLPVSPTSEDPAVAKKTQDALDQAMSAERKARGRASTLVTGGQGITGASGSISRRTLLGS